MTTPVEDILEHFGTRGMHWGIRKATTTAGQHGDTGVLRTKNGAVKVQLHVNPKTGDRVFTDVNTGKIVKTYPAGAKLKVVGETNKPPKVSDDAAVKSTIVKKLNDDGVKSLSNHELKILTDRLNLESNLKKALPTPTAASKKKSNGFIAKLFKDNKDDQIKRVAKLASTVAVNTALSKAAARQGNVGFISGVAKAANAPVIVPAVP